MPLFSMKCTELFPPSQGILRWFNKMLLCNTRVRNCFSKAMQQPEEFADDGADPAPLLPYTPGVRSRPPKFYNSQVHCIVFTLKSCSVLLVVKAVIACDKFVQWVDSFCDYMYLSDYDTSKFVSSTVPCTIFTQRHQIT